MSSYLERVLALGQARARGAAPGPVRQPLDDDTMLKYFVSQLEVRARHVAPFVAGDPTKAETLAEIRAELADFFARLPRAGRTLADEAWNRAYRLERMLALVEPADTLLGELLRRLEEAAEEKIPSAARLRTQFDAAAPHLVDTAQSPPVPKPGAEGRLRALLLDVLEETHWAFQRKFHSRPIQKSATRRLVGMGLVACSLFVLPYACIYIDAWLSRSPYQPPLESWAWLPLWTALTAGFFGAMFSRLLYLQANWNVLSLGALKDARDFGSILLRGAVGMTGAVVVYYFLLSGVVAGALFPNFREIGLHQLSYQDRDSGAGAVPLRLILPNTQLALLVVWSFLAGFSERLVPSILQSTEASLRDGGPKDRK